MPDKNQISVPVFIKDVEPGNVVFISEYFLRINQERTHLYINPYAYATTEFSDWATVELLIDESGKYDFGQQFLMPEVATSCPEGWIEVHVDILTVDTCPDEEEEYFDRQQVEKRWDKYGLEEIFEAMVSITDSLARRNTEKIASLVHIKMLKKYIIDRVHKERDYIQLEPVLIILEDVIAEEDIERPNDVINFYKSIQGTVDQRLAKLMEDPKKRKATEQKSLQDMTLAELKKEFRNYSDKELDAFIDSLGAESSSEDFKKGQYIKDHRQKAK